MSSNPSAATVPISKTASRVCSDQHGEIVELEHTDRVAAGVKRVFVGHPVLAGARQDDRVHLPSIYLDERPRAASTCVAPATHPQNRELGTRRGPVDPAT